MKIVNVDNTEGKTRHTVGKQRVIINGREVIIRNNIIKETVNKILSLKKEDVPQELINYIDGLLLGDGSVLYAGGVSALYMHNTISLEFLEEFQDYYTKYDIKSDITFTKNGKQYRLYSKRLPLFNWFRNRWYKEKENTNEYFKFRKIIPKDIELTSQCVANWYMGDGSLSMYKGSNSIKLSTHSFSQEDVNYLADKLNNMLNIDFRVYEEHWKGKNYYTMKLFGKENMKTFLDYITPHIIDDYVYKSEPFYMQIAAG